MQLSSWERICLTQKDIRNIENIMTHLYLTQQAHSDPFLTSRRLISWWLRELLSVNISMSSRHPPGPRASNMCWDRGLTFSTWNIKSTQMRVTASKSWPNVNFYYNSCRHTALLIAASMEALGMFLFLHCSRIWARFIFISGLGPPSTGEGRN